MRAVYTVGYQRKPLPVFINQLRNAGVDAVIDIRLRNTSHLLGYTKRDTLDFLLREGFAIAYEHHPELREQGTTLVISPLIALMKDQVDSLPRSVRRATTINSTLGRRAAAPYGPSIRRGLPVGLCRPGATAPTAVPLCAAPCGCGANGR